MSATVTIVFNDLAKAQRFMRWMDNSGEQHYFEDMEDNCKDRVSEFRYIYPHNMIYTQSTQDCESDG